MWAVCGAWTLGAEQVLAAEHMLEETKEDLDEPAMLIDQSDDLGRHIQEIRGDQQAAVAGWSAGLALAASAFFMR